jgi:primosomal protein N' (replication factor Y) (superfamily II helicase)
VIADVVFDLPRRQPFSYAVLPGLALARGQRVLAPLRGRPRRGVVVAVREGDAVGLEPVATALEPVPILSEAALRVCEWVAAESLSSVGSTLAALLPPPPGRRWETVAPPAPGRSARTLRPELWASLRRRQHLVEHIAQTADSVLVIVPDAAAAGEWAGRLQAARLDSGASPAARREAWFAAARGRVRAVVGSRSALLAPLPPPAMLVLLDEHDSAHRPPGPPRMHPRDLLRQRAATEGSRLVLLAGAPSCETWWQCEQGEIARTEGDRGSWPELVTADIRGILRNHPLTLPLSRAIEESARRGRRVALIVSRSAAGLACNDCGTPVRCPDCGIALVHARGAALATCRLCSRTEPVPDICSVCGGHRLAPFGWSAERVEVAVARRFPRLRVARAASPADKPDDTNAHVVIGTPSLLRGIEPGSVGAVGFVSLDGLLRLPDFRAGERVFQSLWAAAEAAGPSGRIVVQTIQPAHHAIVAARTQDRAAFYAMEIESRRALGYPPFRRLCLVTVRGRDAASGRALAEECATAMRSLPALTVYAAAAMGAPGGRRPRWQVVVKGPPGLPHLVAEPLRDVLERSRRPAGVVLVEMDPVTFS